MKLKTFSLKKTIDETILKNKKDIKLFFVLFIISILIYGKKIFFYSLASDDYARFYSQGGEQASWLGRWMAGIFNQYIFTGPLHILPYFNTLLGVFSFTLAGFLTAKFFNKNTIIETTIITLLIAVTPFFAHNLYFNTNISTWITTLLGVLGFLLLYKPSFLLKSFGFVLLVIAIGSYQAIIQVAIAMVIIKTILSILDATSLKELKKIALISLKHLSLILLAFAVSMLINTLYIKFHHLTVSGRLKNVGHITFLTFLKRIIIIYKTSFKLEFFQSKFLFFYSSFFILSFFGVLYKLFKKKIAKNVKVFSLLLVLIIFISIPLIINLPLLTGNYIPTRTHYAIGWFLAGFFVIQMNTFKGVFETISFTLAFIIIIISSLFINVFYDASQRQANADFVRINQIVNRIRTNPNYTTEPLKLKIVGVKKFSVTGWKSEQQVLNTNWSKYTSFKYFTDLNFSQMKDEEYDEMLDYLVEKGEEINEYPAKNSIVVYQNKAVLFLKPPPKKNGLEIKLPKMENRTPDIQSNFNIYFENGNLYFYKSPCTKEDIKHRFILYIYPKNRNDLPEKSKKQGFQIMDFNFKNNGILKNGKGLAMIKLPDYPIQRIYTGQYNRTKKKKEWSCNYKFK